MRPTATDCRCSAGGLLVLQRHDAEGGRPDRRGGHQRRRELRKLAATAGEHSGRGISEIARDPDPQPLGTLGPAGRHQAESERNVADYTRAIERLFDSP